jgi:hypothetical protein
MPIRKALYSALLYSNLFRTVNAKFPNRWIMLSSYRIRIFIAIGQVNFMKNSLQSLYVIRKTPVNFVLISHNLYFIYRSNKIHN